WPILIEMILMSLLGSIDIFMLSQYSDNGVAVVGIINQIVWMTNLAFGIISSGTAILIAQYLGSKSNEDDVLKISSISLMLNGVLGVCLSFVMITFSKTIMRMLNTPEELIKLGSRYMIIVAGASFVIAILMTLTSIIRAHGFTKECMKVTIFMNVMNVILNYILIFGKFGFPEMGVTGAAIATTICRSLAVIFLGYKVYKIVLYKFKATMFRSFPMEYLRKILFIGIPTAGEQLSYNLSQLVVTSIINTMSIESMVAKSYVSNIAFLAFMFSAALGQGGSIVVGNLIGEGKEEEAYSLYKYANKIGMIVSFTMAGIIALSSSFILGIFTDNQAVISIGIIILIIDVFLEPGRAMNLVGINTLRATGDVKYPVYIGIFSMWFFAVGFAYILGVPLGLGIYGIWIAFGIDEWFRGLLIKRRWSSKAWCGKSFVASNL
ncbi:MAG: MATE family efflux transporter, partial [Sarcina sp.]